MKEQNKMERDEKILNLELKEGVTYKRRNGETTELTYDDDGNCYYCDKGWIFEQENHGGYARIDGDHENDLIGIIEEDVTGELAEVVEQRIDKIRSLLASKAEEYVTGEDRLGNFKAGAEMSGLTPKQYLFANLTKHMVCVRDIVHGKLDSKHSDEKIGDAINYLILLEALIAEESK